MKKKTLLYLAGAAVAAYFLFRKKPTMQTASANMLSEAKEAANNILTMLPGGSETPQPITELPAPQLKILSSPPKYSPTRELDMSIPFLKSPYMPNITTEPINVVQSNLVDFPQLSPSPASVLSPDQLIKFNKAATKGQLMGVC
jgi:hypothetical protein